MDHQIDSPRPNGDIGFYLKKINDKLSKRANNSMRSMGVTISQAHIIGWVSRFDEQGVTLKELEKVFSVAQATMAGIVARLDEKGLVKSFRDPNDARVKRVRITEAGMGICDETRKNIQNTEQLIRKDLTEHEFSELERLLKIVLTTLEEDEKRVGEGSR